MARSVARLDVERTSLRGLWVFARRAVRDIGPGSLMPYEEQKKVFEALEDALDQIQLRGEQLSFLPEQHQDKAS